MPKIPTYLASYDYQPSRGNVEGAGAPGRALAKLGETAAGVASDIGERLKAKALKAQAEAERSNAAVRQLDKTMKAARESTEDFRNHGVRDAMEGYQMRIGQMTKEVADSIHDPEARRQYERDAQTVINVYSPIATGAQVNGFTAQAHEQTVANLAIYLKTAEDAQHPLERDVIFELVEREISGKAREGLYSEEQADQVLQDFYGNLAHRLAKRAITEDPQAALADLESDRAFPMLDDEARVRLIDEARRTVREQTARRETKIAAERRDLQGQIPGYLYSLRDGGTPDDERFGRDRLIAVLGEPAGARLWTQIERAKVAQAPMEAIRWASPAEIDTRLTALKADPAQASDAGELSRAIDRRKKQLYDRPLDYVLANPYIAELHEAMVQSTTQPAESPAMADTLQGQTAGVGPLTINGRAAEDRRAVTATYANGILAEQERLGVPGERQQVLPEAMARDFVADMAGKDPAEVDRRLRDLAADWGEAWPWVLADLSRAGLPDELVWLGRQTNPVERNRLISMLAQRALDPDAIRGGVGDRAGVIDGMIASVSDFRLAGANASANAPEMNARSDEDSGSDSVADSKRLQDIRNVYGAVGQGFSRGRVAARDASVDILRGRLPGPHNSIFDYLVDLARGAGGGAFDAARETLATIDLIRELTGAKSNLASLVKTPNVLMPKTQGGEFAQSAAQFMVGFLPALGAIRLASGGRALTKVGRWVESQGAAGIASAVVMDPLTERWSDELKKLGVPDNFVTDFLASKPDDTQAEGRLKNALEALFIPSALSDGLWLAGVTLRGLKRILEDEEDSSSEPSSGEEPLGRSSKPTS